MGLVLCKELSCVCVKYYTVPVNNVKGQVELHGDVIPEKNCVSVYVCVCVLTLIHI